jgi:hypothetical protein
MKPLSDTTPAARAVFRELLRKKTAEERLRIAREWTLGAQRLAFAAMRQQHPELSEDDVWVRLAERRLGADVVRKVRGR